MAWSKFYPFEKEEIKKRVKAEKAGIYRITLEENKLFRITQKGKKQIWKGIYILDGATFKQLHKRTLVYQNNTGIYTNLAYIGKSTTLQKRLLQHFSGRANQGIKKLMKYDMSLRFSYFSSQNCDKAELLFYKAFIKQTKFCPPCDQNSAECKACEGNYVKCHIERTIKTGKRLSLIC